MDSPNENRWTEISGGAPCAESEDMANARVLHAQVSGVSLVPFPVANEFPTKPSRRCYEIMEESFPHDDTETEGSNDLEVEKLPNCKETISNDMKVSAAEEEEEDEMEMEEADSSSNHSIIPWLFDLEADEDDRLLDSAADSSSELEIDTCQMSGSRFTDAGANQEERARFPSHEDRRGNSFTCEFGRKNSKEEFKPANGVNQRWGSLSEGCYRVAERDRVSLGSAEFRGSQGSCSSPSDDCPSIRICKMTPGFLRINPRDSESDDNPTTGGRALLSRTLDQVRRRLMDDLSPVLLLPDYDDDIKEMESAKLRGTYIKNLLVLSFGFMLVFTSFCSLRSLQSSINHDGGLGLAALSCMNATFAVGCIFATSIVQRMRPKRAIMISLVGHLLYTVANVKASFYVLLPATAVVGLTMAVLFVAQGTYLTSIAVTYAAVSGKKHDHIVSLFNGFFLFMLQISQIFGNLISSTVFSLLADETRETDAELGANETYVYGSGVEASVDRNGTPCGSGYCHMFLIESSKMSLYEDTVVILMAIFFMVTSTGMMILGLFLDKLDVIFHKSKQGLVAQLCAILRLHRDRRMRHCVLLMTFLGMQEAFVYGEFTKGYVTCPLGLHMIGYVMMCFAGCASLTSVTVGYLQRCMPRAIIIGTGAVLHLALMSVLYLWQPSTDDLALIFIMAGALGVADAMWQTEMCSLCGVLFDRRHREASFSCLRMYQSLGLCLTFGYAQFICMEVKVVILAAVLVLAMVAYCTMEVCGEVKDEEKELEEPASI